MPDPTALLIGVIGAVVGAWVVTVRPSWIDPIEAALLAVVVLARQANLATGRVGLAVVIVMLAGRLPDRLWWVRWGAVLVACLTFARDHPGGDRWLGIAAVVAGVVLVALARACARSFGPTLTAAGLAWVPAAAYLGPPDTEQTTMAAAALGLLAVVALLFDWEPSAPALDAAAVHVVWAIMAGARGREASFVVIGAAAVLVVGAGLAGMGRRVRWPTPAAVGLAAVHMALGVTVARYASLGSDISTAVGRAALVVVGGLAVAVPLSWFASARPRNPGRHAAD